MIYGQPKPSVNDAIEVEPWDLVKISRTLNDLPEKPQSRVCLFTDGDMYILVDTGGYDYPRHKTPRMTKEIYEGTSDGALERMFKVKAVGDEVDYTIGKVNVHA